MVGDVQIPVIVGPTAGGKSAVAVCLAERLAHRAGGEVVTCDAFQVYRGMDIGTAKPTNAERRGIPHHLIDLVEPTERYSVQRWLDDADAVMTEIQSRGKVPIVVGGTHLFVKALLDGLFEGPPGDESLREELRALGPKALRAELEARDPATATRLHPNDERRTVRALEVLRLTGKPISEWQTQWDDGQDSGPLGARRYQLIGLEWPAEVLNRRINERVRGMIDAGLVDEARQLHEADRLGPQAREALGYKQLFPYFEGIVPLDEAVEKIKIETRRFGKNQRTWLRRLRAKPGSVWIEAEGRDPQEISQTIAMK
ncbi:MAG: tRNA (adenosine(37)-N6)-dimethylallyltransferase MiaA [Planctomycetota bacterium]